MFRILYSRLAFAFPKTQAFRTPTPVSEEQGYTGMDRVWIYRTTP